MQSITDLKDWIGRELVRSAVIDHRQVELMAATVDCEAPEAGKDLPGLWHWCWFNDALPAEELGRDGHPRLGIFLPPVPLPRRTPRFLAAQKKASLGAFDYQRVLKLRQGGE